MDFGVRLAVKRSSLEKSLAEEKPGAELGWAGRGGACTPGGWNFCGDLGLHYAAPQEFV